MAQLETDKKILGEKIKKFRKLKSLTQAELAEAVSLNVKQISRIEAGLNYPTYTSFSRLIDTLNIDINDFCTSKANNYDAATFQIMEIINNADDNKKALYLGILKYLEENLKNLQK